jgi:hypothetical protein
MFSAAFATIACRRIGCCRASGISLQNGFALSAEDITMSELRLLATVGEISAM